MGNLTNYYNKTSQPAFPVYNNGSSNLTLSDISANMGNWSADKSTYASQAYANSLGNWSGNSSSYTTTANLVAAVGNWSADKSTYASQAYANSLGNWSGNSSTHTFAKSAP